MPHEATTPNDHLALRDQLDQAGIQWCLAGGQAVNVWGEHYKPFAPILKLLGLFTSKDIDPLILTLANTDACPNLKITGWNSDSPVSGTVAGQGEMLKFLPGVPDRQWVDRIQRVDGWPIVPADALYASKCWNLINIPQIDRDDARHLFILNHVMAPYLKRAPREHQSAITETLQQIASDGTLARAIQLASPEIASNVLPHVTLAPAPFPRFNVCPALYDRILKFSPGAANLQSLSPREAQWSTVVPQFHDRAEAEKMFEEQYKEPIIAYIDELAKAVNRCQNYSTS